MLTMSSLIFLFPRVWEKRALVVCFQFPTAEPWEDYVILGYESSAACGVIPSAEHARGAFFSLAASEDCQEHQSTMFPPRDKIPPPFQ